MYLVDYSVSTPEVEVVVSDITSIEDNYYTSFLDVYYPDGHHQSGWLDFNIYNGIFTPSYGLYEDAIYDPDDEEIESLPEHLQNIDIEPLVEKLVDDILPELKEFHNA